MNGLVGRKEEGGGCRYEQMAPIFNNSGKYWNLPLVERATKPQSNISFISLQFSNPVSVYQSITKFQAAMKIVSFYTSFLPTLKFYSSFAFGFTF